MKRNFFNYLVIVAIIAITVLATFTSCKKDDDEKKIVDVYVVGRDLNSETWLGTVWKNGVVQNFTDETRFSGANSVYISDNDVYVAGTMSIAKDIPIVATIWTNGVEQNLPVSNGAEAMSVYVCGDNVYAAGYEYKGDGGSFAKIWKNGVAQNLTDGIRSAVSYSVFVSCCDVYVAGYEMNEQNKGVAKLWKDGIVQNLTDGTRDAAAFSVYVSGKDVYVAGSESNFQDQYFPYIAKLWKNGIVQNLNASDGEQSAQAFSVFVAEK